ncbi:hypothetical protein B0O80DRAFT_500433 [Mortierella sp. GBAus27b]|nr:hypothetical protein BGX31_002954 [Mortierella sp. GBA43]KAI8351107.1 hypothetical protein B0O80DRAFT_500433 [Mortierella sp. GBAus27b]
MYRTRFPPLETPRYAPQPPKALQRPEDSQRRLRPRKNKASGTNDHSHESRVSQEAVLNIPELLDLITSHLTKDDLRVLIQVCRAWNAFWIPYIYSTLFFRKYRRTHIYPKIQKYGDHVRSLDLYQTKWNNIVHLLDFAVNIRSLSICGMLLTDSQIQSLTETVPQLRNLRLSFTRGLTFGRGVPKTTDPRSMSIVAALSNLEELEWDASGALRVDDILCVLKACSKLRKLALSGVDIVEELQESELDNNRTLVKVDDDGWQNATLRTIKCTNIVLGARQSCHDPTKHAHPCVRRLFQHLPSLKTIQFTGTHNLSALDWHSVFDNRSIVEHVDIGISPHYWNRNRRVEAPEALSAIAMSCSNLKTLDARNLHPTSDNAFEQLLSANHNLQRVLARSTEFGDLSLKALARPTNYLVELDLEECIHITSKSMDQILENCGLLRDLNLSGTKAVTTALFQSNKPWPCSKTMERLKLDIQHVGFIPRQAPLDHIKRCTPEECLAIKTRLTSFTALVGLKLGGEAMSFDILDDMSFAPGLRRVILNVPFAGPDTLARYSLARTEATERGKAMFPNWIVSASAYYISYRLSCVVHANINREPFLFGA